MPGLTQPSVFAVVRFTPDAGAGECLNVGMLLFHPEEKRLVCRFEEKTRRLSEAFDAFDYRAYRTAVARLKARVENASLTIESPSFNFEGKDSQASFARLVGQLGLNSSSSLRIAAERSSVTFADADRMVEGYFQRYVRAGVRPSKQPQRRKDADIWSNFQSKVKSQGVIPKFEERLLEIGNDAPLKLEHTLKNGILQALQPLSFDLADADSVRDKALRWWAYSTALAEHGSLDRISFLVAEPTGKGLARAFDGAIMRLDRAPIQHDIVVESVPSQFEGAAKMIAVALKHATTPSGLETTV